MFLYIYFNFFPLAIQLIALTDENLLWRQTAPQRCCFSIHLYAIFISLHFVAFLFFFFNFIFLFLLFLLFFIFCLTPFIAVLWLLTHLCHAYIRQNDWLWQPFSKKVKGRGKNYENYTKTPDIDKFARKIAMHKFLNLNMQKNF